MNSRERRAWFWHWVVTSVLAVCLGATGYQCWKGGAPEQMTLTVTDRPPLLIQ